MSDFEPSNSLTQPFQAVNTQIELACEQASRQHGSVALLAVSKRHPSAKIKQLHALGQNSFGENYVQEGVEKVQELAELDIEWHFIGPIQSNKSRLVSEHFHWVHTLDSEKLARRLNDQRPAGMKPLNVLIQINISEQDTKSGIHISELPNLANNISQMPNLTLRGLMCIPAPLDEIPLKADFSKMNTAFKELQNSYPQVDTLSMGMSGDLSSAIECGSTMVRIGSALFGQRPS